MKLVLVEWVDSQRRSANWTPVTEVAKPRRGGLRCCSVGWVVHDTKDAVVLMPNITDDGDDMQCVHGLEIPKCSITRMRRLK